MPVVHNGFFVPCTRVLVGAEQVEYFRTALGAVYRKAHPMQRADIIYQPKTPGLPRSRMLRLDPVPEAVAAAFARHDDGLAAVNGKVKANGMAAPTPASSAAAKVPALAPMKGRPYPKTGQVARKGPKIRKPARGLGAEK